MHKHDLCPRRAGFGLFPVPGARLALITLCCALALLPARAGFAQTIDAGTIRGHVADQNGAAVVGAEVRVANDVTGLSRTAHTDDGGNYTVTGLPLTGKYKVSFTASAFAPREVGDVELRAGAAATLDATLSPAGVKIENVTVIGTTDTVQSDTAQLATRLDLQKIEETPVFGRKITNLVQLNSAVRPARGTGDLFLNNFLFIVNGSGRRQTTVQIDGSDGDDSWGRQTLFTNVPLATLQEFTVITNGASAEYGRTAGAAVNIVTKSGTNDFHTDVIGVARPGSLQARAPGAPLRTIDRLAQFSGILSGPIKRDRTHFLLGAEINIQRRDSVIVSRVAPTTNIFTGDYHQGLFFGRIDHQLNARNMLTMRANADRFNDTNPAEAVSNTVLPSAGRKFSRRTYAAQLSETATLNRTLVNEARFQFQLASPITEFTPFNPSPQFVRPPGISTEGESRSALLINHQYEMADTLSLTRGQQYLKFGGGAIFSTSGGKGQEFGSGFTLGQFTFVSGAGCPAGTGPCVPTSQLTIAQVASYSQSFGSANYNIREWLWNIFAQDDVRVRPNLTLNLGLRYERQTFTDDKNNFAPRLGFAYSFNSNHTVLRGSYGIYYSELRANYGAQFALAGPTGVFNFTATPGQLGFPTSFAPLPAFPAGASIPARDLTIRPGRAAFYQARGIDTTKLKGYPDKFLNPYTQQASIGVQHELPWKFFLNVDYVYAHTIGIDRAEDLNAPSLFIPTLTQRVRTAAQANATRPIVPVPNGYRRILVVMNNGSTVYNGMQLNLDKRFSHHFSLLASYTWSHTINTVEPDAPGPDPMDVNLPLVAERGNSLLDQRHRAVISGWYELPYGFTFGGVTTLASGRPFNVTVGTDVNGDGVNNDRPFDFTTGTFLGRNTGRGTPVYQTDLFLERTFKFGERVQVGLRAEGFNIFNRSNFVARNGAFYQTYTQTTQTPSAAFGTPIFGINGTDPARMFQFQLRVRY